MITRILTYTPTDGTNITSATAYGHQFIAGVPLDLADDECAYDKLKRNPEFNSPGRAKDPAPETLESAFPDDSSADESNEGKDAKMRAVVQKRAILTQKSAPAKEEA